MAKPRMDLSAFVGKLLEGQDGDVLREGIRVLSQALSQARLRERRLAVITVQLGGLADIERALDVTVCEQLVSTAAQRLHTSIFGRQAVRRRSAKLITPYSSTIIARTNVRVQAMTPSMLKTWYDFIT